MLRTTLNKRWQYHTYDIELYRNILNSRLKLDNIECVSRDIVGEAEKNCSAKCFCGNLYMDNENLDGCRRCILRRDDSGCTTDELKTVMGNRDEWIKRVMLGRTSSTW